jgi:hypothetical protein
MAPMNLKQIFIKPKTICIENGHIYLPGQPAFSAHLLDLACLPFQLVCALSTCAVLDLVFSKLIYTNVHFFNTSVN